VFQAKKRNKFQFLYLVNLYNLIHLPKATEISLRKLCTSGRRGGYLTVLARTGFDGELNYTNRNIVEKLFQTIPMRISRFHETCNTSLASADHWLTGFVRCYNQLRSHQSLDNQKPAQVTRIYF